MSQALQLLRNTRTALRCVQWSVSTRMAGTATMDVSYDDLKALMEKGQNLLLVDVRTQQEVDKGRIPGSLHIPVDEVQGAFGLEPEAFKAKYGVTKPPLNSSELVFHCQMGKRGATATTKANQLGYLNARNYAGGYKEWSERGGK
ncbi:thiosulfate:glutathione sulfurtransferase [Syngnathus scovelli]|uniref:thiosulfate:glutathione sulfurtransferase n=1 Tax=Syngnathus scovelli TaxID=161590 RepID=UPI00210F2ABA|nr:thiosulfate:glutathione sulfurtransferase [Syngnathus scovelli]